MRKIYYITLLILMISCDLRNPNYSDEEIIKMKHDIIENGDDESYNEIYSNIGRKDSLLNIEMLPYSLKMMDVKNSESEHSFFEFFLRAKFKGKYNPNDLIKLAKPEQDLLIYYLEKLDITEEKVRLTNHLDYFLQTLNGSEANGRKLGFITQEMGREINTMGSKSNHAEMQKLVVMMKDELEKIKEQVLNVL